jgi:orotate phosphoribosyltransferase
MIYKKEIANTLAEYLLQINAIKLNLHTPFTWASGWKSPIYCDNRLTLSYPLCRTYIKEGFAALIHDHFENVNCIAGVATAGIPHGALVADAVQKPFSYVRSAPKAHGLTNKIEGKISKGDRVVVVEDLISTGKSSLEVVDALRDAGAEVIGMIAIFTYGFPVAEEAFKAANCPYYTLSNYNTLIQLAVAQQKIEANQLATLQSWRENPADWTV